MMGLLENSTVIRLGFVLRIKLDLYDKKNCLQNFTKNTYTDTNKANICSVIYSYIGA